MDLVAGVKRVVVVMEHVTKSGAPKILRDCRLPLTGKSCVDCVITDLAVFQIDRRKGEMFLTELAPNVTVGEIAEKTDARFHNRLRA